MHDRTRRLTEVRVFVASPSDVPEERYRIEFVVKQLNQGLARRLGLTIALQGWEHVAPNVGRPQDVIFQQMPPEDWDIFIGVLWLRFGAETGEIDPQTKQPYRSGTEEEFKAAYRQHQADHTGWPKVMVYRCIRNPENNLYYAQTENHTQFERVTKFFENCKPDGEHPMYVVSYNHFEEFERHIRNHLEKYLEEFVKTLPPAPPKPDDEILPPISPLPVVDRELERNLFRKILKGETTVRGLVIHSRGQGGWGKSVLLQMFEKECAACQSPPTEVFSFDPSDTGANWLSIMDRTARKLGVEHFPRYMSVRATTYSKESREQAEDDQEIYTPSADAVGEQREELGETASVVRIRSSYDGERSESTHVDMTKIFLQELESFPQPLQVVWLVDAVDWIDRDTRDWLIKIFGRIYRGTLTKVILVAAGRDSLYYHPSWKGKVEEIDVCRFEKKAIPELLLHFGFIDRIDGVEKLCELIADDLFQKTNGKPLDICTHLQSRRDKKD